jgi:hypothetical protein
VTRQAEFTKQTKREAWDRSGGLCEASGELYGLPPGQRCNMPLRTGVEYDHIILEANSHDNSLGNCAAVCPPCHRYKTDKHDTPTAAKTQRQEDKNIGIRSKVYRPFPKQVDPWGKRRFAE